ncbi:MAG: gas vesicle protein K [Cyanobacteria bacterium J069]|nr:MAG: gas vesicle protein K [Cyanobacteria bacterium J069]
MEPPHFATKPASAPAAADLPLASNPVAPPADISSADVSPVAVSPADISPADVSLAPAGKSDAGLAPLLLTVVELVRQLMEAQVIRRMEDGLLSDADLDRAAESLRKLEEQVVHLCDVFEVDPADLNIDLGEIGTLLPKAGGYYPGEQSTNPSILELLDRLLNTGVVVEGDVDLGLAQLNLIHAKLRLVLTSKPL